VEPLAQQEVDKARRADAEARGILDMKIVPRDFGDAAFGWVFREPLTLEQERFVLGTRNAYVAEWAERNGGVLYTQDNSLRSVSFTHIRLAVTNRWPAEVSVTEIRAVVDRAGPLAGALVFAGSQGGEPVIDVGFDLEEDEPVARVRRQDGTLGERYTDKETVQLVPDEIVVFDFTAEASRSSCRWSIELEALVDGQLRTFAPGEGRQFVTTAAAPRYKQRYYYDVSDSGWHAAGAGGLE
jgi:hypothetical protein